MAAPSTTVWGNTVIGSSSNQGKIGIYTGVTSTSTTVTVSIEVWFWSKYGVSDTNNSYYYNGNATSATTLIGSKSIKHTVSSGNGWSTSNQTKLGSTSYTYNKGTSATTKSYAAKLTGIDILGSSNVMTATTSITVPALASYTVAYNMNGGSGSISSQTKYYGKSLTLSSTVPTKTGYSFQGWATSSSGSVAYKSGASYTANAAVTLYAVWKANTYTITYNANGGTGQPTNQTKVYGQTLKLSTVKPTREDFNFLGWATSATATTATYAAGANYTSDAAATLYAVWKVAYIKPRITGFVLSRCDAEGTMTDEGTNAVVGFSWVSDLNVSLVKIEWKLANSTEYAATDSVTVEASGTSGAVNEIVGGGIIDNEKTYTFRLTVADGTDDSHKTQKTSNLSGSIYHIDFKPPTVEGEVGGVSIGKPAELDGVFDVGFAAKFSGGMVSIIAEKVSDLNDLTTPNTYVSVNQGASTYANIPNGLEGTFTIEVLGAGAEGQLMQRITTCSKTEPYQYIRHYFHSEWGEWIRLFGVTLYYNKSGTNGAVTLTESCANFRAIDIYYTDNNGKSGGYTRVLYPNGKTISLSMIEGSSANQTYFRRTNYTIAETTITPDLETAGFARIATATASHTSGTNYIKIICVVGYQRTIL